jgi:pimeloyl-ACP methyl ester carboxylesterase
MPYRDINGTSLFFTVEDGTASDVLLVHGGGCDSHDWSWEVPRLAERGRRVIAVDLRGHGRSGVPRGAHVPSWTAARTWVPEQFGFRPQSEAFLVGRRCPVLSIWRREEQAEWERSIVSGAGSLVLAWEGQGHWLHQERPDDFHAAVLDWIPA